MFEFVVTLFCGESERSEISAGHLLLLLGQNGIFSVRRHLEYHCLANVS